MRHDGGNALKDQGNWDGLTAVPLNAMECEAFQFAHIKVEVIRVFSGTAVLRVEQGDMLAESGGESEARPGFPGSRSATQGHAERGRGFFGFLKMQSHGYTSSLM
jgi:hypothetical protein